jgi:hypothetical protein
MNLADYVACDATELGRLLASGVVSAEEVREAGFAGDRAGEPVAERGRARSV